MTTNLQREKHSKKQNRPIYLCNHKSLMSHLQNRILVRDRSPRKIILIHLHQHNLANHLLLPNLFLNRNPLHNNQITKQNQLMFNKTLFHLHKAHRHSLR
eukprot:NODE_202_length_13094_cov_1.571528.p12 type:complete len:100 gc:universal NODE_202_length_13094_cov_1.571528:11266-10967(-)